MVERSRIQIAYIHERANEKSEEIFQGNRESLHENICLKEILFGNVDRIEKASSRDDKELSQLEVEELLGNQIDGEISRKCLGLPPGA